MKSRYLILSMHIAAWASYVFLPLAVFPQPSLLFTENEFFALSYSLTTIFCIGFFYYTSYFVIPKFFFPRKYFKFALLIIGYVAVSMAIMAFGETNYFRIRIDLRIVKGPIYLSLFLRLFLLFIISFGLMVYKKMLEVEAERARTELSLLKAQVNPHFLFNTLNGLYALALTKSDLTAESISKLSSIMRYSISDGQSSRIELEKEIEFINDYLDLQRLRLTPKTKLHFRATGDFMGKFIEPLMLISFIENAFKYGVSNEKESNILIQISLIYSTLHVFVQNDKVNAGIGGMSSSELGIANSRKRLELNYPENHKLYIEDKPNKFVVKIEIKL